jgi:hypothetical protein
MLWCFWEGCDEPWSVQQDDSPAASLPSLHRVSFAFTSDDERNVEAATG